MKFRLLVNITALYLAVANENVEIVKLLMMNENIDINNLNNII